MTFHNSHRLCIILHFEVSLLIVPQFAAHVCDIVYCILYIFYMITIYCIVNIVYCILFPNLPPHVCDIAKFPSPRAALALFLHSTIRSHRHPRITDISNDKVGHRGSLLCDPSLWDYPPSSPRLYCSISINGKFPM